MTDSERIGVLCQEFCSGLSSQDVPRILARGGASSALLWAH